MGINVRSNFCCIALAPTGEGISGGDRIFIELARQWSQNLPVTIYTTSEGVVMAKRFKLSGELLNIINIGKKKLPDRFFLKYLYKIYLGIKLSFSLTIDNQPSTIVYSSSEFWMDSLPAFILKMRYSKIKWVAAWYQTAQNPLKGLTEGKRKRKYYLTALLHYLIQLPIKPIISKFADFVLVNNETEKNRFANLNKKGRVVVVLGAIDIQGIKTWKAKFKLLPKIYDAVFQGRFHPQKGVLELIEIWKKVIEQKPDAKLVMIGNGPLFKEVEKKISELGLQDNIKLTDYLFDGLKKYKIFSQSKIVVHPSFYDSGGMAAAEAMAFGLPCVGFDLIAYKSYYPKGMVKIRIGDLDAFASSVCRLLENINVRSRIAGEALEMIDLSWSWDSRVRMLSDAILK